MRQTFKGEAAEENKNLDSKVRILIFSVTAASGFYFVVVCVVNGGMKYTPSRSNFLPECGPSGRGIYKPLRLEMSVPFLFQEKYND